MHADFMGILTATSQFGPREAPAYIRGETSPFRQIRSGHDARGMTRNSWPPASQSLRAKESHLRKPAGRDANRILGHYASINSRGPSMIDNPKQVADLLAKLEAALPLPAIVTPRLAAALRQQSPVGSIQPRCEMTWVSNAGDEGGIVCKLSIEGESGGKKLQLFTSIPRLDFDRRLPLAHEIVAYQKR